MERSKARIEIPRSQVSVKTVLTVASTTIAIVAVVYTLTNIKIALGLIIVSGLLATALHHLVEALSKRSVPRWLAITLVMLGVLLLFTGLGLLFVPRVITQARGLVERAPDFFDRLQQSGVYEYIDSQLNLGQRIDQFRANALKHVQDALDITLRAVTTILALVGAAVTIFFLIIFMLIFGDELIHRLLDEATPMRRQRYQRVLTKVYRAIGGYLGGLFVVVLSNSVLTSIFLAVMGVPYFLPLGILAGLSSLIPLVGSTIAGVVIVLVVLGTNGLWPAVAVTAWVIVYQQFENHVLGPAIYKRTANVNPLIEVLAVLVLTELAGIAGALIAVPFVAIAQILVRELLALRRELLNVPTDGPVSTRSGSPES